MGVVMAWWWMLGTWCLGVSREDGSQGDDYALSRYIPEECDRIYD